MDRQRTYSYYVKGLVKGALINLGAALQPEAGKQKIEVYLWDLGTNVPEKPFELDLKVVLPHITDARY